MAITQRLEDGSLVILDAGGWRRASPQEEAAQGMGRGESWALGAMNTVAGYGSMLGRLMDANVRLQSRGEVNQRSPLTTGADQIQQNLAPVERANPGAFGAGGLWGDPGMIASVVGAGGAMVRRGLAARVQGQVAQAATRTASQAEQAAAAAGPTGPENIPGFSSMGAASSREGLVRRMIRKPGQYFDDLKSAVDEFLSPEALTPDQREMLPVGERLGFRFLPGQREGAQGLRRLAGSDPVIEAAFAPEMEANRRGLRAAAARAIGINADDFSRNMLGQAADQVDDVMRATAEGIGRVTLDDQTRAAVELLRGEEKFLSLPAEGAYTGEQIMALRSNLGEASRNAWAQGAQAPAGKAEFIDNVIDTLDDLIETQLAPEQQAAWRIARERWKNIKVLESSGAIVNEAGEINFRSLSTAMRRRYKGAYGRQVTGEGGRRLGLTPETQQFMDWTRLAGQFGDNFPNSGTASRTRLVQVMTNPKELAKSMMLRAAIESAAP